MCVCVCMMCVLDRVLVRVCEEIVTIHQCFGVVFTSGVCKWDVSYMRCMLGVNQKNYS